MSIVKSRTPTDPPQQSKSVDCLFQISFKEAVKLEGLIVVFVKQEPKRWPKTTTMVADRRRTTIKVTDATSADHQ